MKARNEKPAKDKAEKKIRIKKEKTEAVSKESEKKINEKKKAAPKGAKAELRKEQKKQKEISAGIPYSRVYESMNMFAQDLSTSKKDIKFRFSICYIISNILVENVIDTNPEELSAALERLIDGFPEDISFQFLIVNEAASPEKFLQRALLTNDGRPEYTEAIGAYNALLKENAGIGHNNMTKRRYIIFSTVDEDPEKADALFHDVEQKARELFKAVCGLSIRILSVKERLALMYSLYNPGGGKFGARAGAAPETLNLSDAAMMKISTKDLIAPKSAKEEKNMITLNEKAMCRLFFINNFPTLLVGALVSELTAVSSSMVYSALYEPLDTEFAYNLAQKDVADNMIVRRRHSQASLAEKKTGKTVSVHELKNRTEHAYFTQEALEVLLEAKASNTKTFMCTVVIALYADNPSDLSRDTELLTLSASKFAFQIKRLDYAQKKGLHTILPLGMTELDVRRVFSAERIAPLTPIDIQSSLKKDGLFYGINSINDNIILLNRKNITMPSGLITGIRNAGKTYQVKREAFNNLISTDDDVYIICGKSQAEKYRLFVPRMKGQIFTDADFDPFQQVDDYGVVGDSDDLKGTLLSAIFSCVLQIRKTSSASDADAVEKEIDAECLEIAKHHSDLIANAAFISDHPDQMKWVIEAINKMDYTYINGGHADMDKCRLNCFCADTEADLLIVLDRIWNRTIERKKANHSSWIYIDSIDDIIKVREGARYIKKLLHLSNVMQNPLTLVIQSAASFGSGERLYLMKSLFTEMKYYKLLNMGPVERHIFAESLHIPDSLLPYITNSGVGKGIIVSQSSTTPFNDNISEIITEKDYRTVHRYFY